MAKEKFVLGGNHSLFLETNDPVRKRMYRYRHAHRRPLQLSSEGRLDMLPLCKPTVVVVCPLQPSSSVNSGCPDPESSVLVSS